MREKLFGTTDRDASHKKLEEVLAEGRHPRACCTEDPNDPIEPFQVWTDGPPAHVKAPGSSVEDMARPVGLSQAELDRLALRISEMMKGKG
jgi:hypothetical protein